MASYNRWMNEGLYAICAEPTDDERKADRGAFFHSVHGTLNHLLLGDRIWMGRFTGTPYSVNGLDQELYSDFAELRSQRSIMDDRIETWAAGDQLTTLLSQARKDCGSSGVTISAA